MTQQTTTYHTAHIWERGHRASNEDSIVILDVLSGGQHIFLAVVADGIGGLSEGGYASAYVTGQLRSRVADFVKKDRRITLKMLSRSVLRTLYNCHLHLLNYGVKHAIHTGTTVSILCLIGRRGFALQVGDSHLYRIGHHIRKIGHDNIDRNGHLTGCIGSGKYHRIPIIKLRINKNDTVVLCTDGFYRLGASQLSTFRRGARTHGSDEAEMLGSTLARIRDHAYSHGERDNMSAIAVRCS